MNEQFLPVDSPEEKETTIGDYIFEPNQKDIVDELIPKSLKTQCKTNDLAKIDNFDLARIAGSYQRFAK